MAITTNLIISGSIVPQVARLSNGWLVTVYSNGRNSFQLIVSKNNGTSWSNLCQLYTGNSTDYVIGIDAILADGNNVMVVGGYGDINNNDRIFTCYFNATTVTTSTNLYTDRSSGSITAYVAVDDVKYLQGRYHYLTSVYSEASNTDQYRHVSMANTDAPSAGTMYTSVTRSSSSTFGGADVHAPSSEEAWVFYGLDNTLLLRRRLTATGTFQAVQTAFTLNASYRIRRVQVITYNGVVYVFFSWLSSDNARVGLAYVTTTNGTTFSSATTIFDLEPINKTGQYLDFDVIAGDKIAVLAAVPIFANRTLYTCTITGGAAKTKALEIVVPNKNGYQKSIRAIAVNNKEYSFSADLDNGTNVIKFKIEVDGIKRFSGSAWESIEQGYRYGTSWQENNGKRFNGSTWQDIN